MVRLRTRANRKGWLSVRDNFVITVCSCWEKLDLDQCRKAGEWVMGRAGGAQGCLLEIREYNVSNSGVLICCLKRKQPVVEPDDLVPRHTHVAMLLRCFQHAGEACSTPEFTPQTSCPIVWRCGLARPPESHVDLLERTCHGVFREGNRVDSLRQSVKGLFGLLTGRHRRKTGVIYFRTETHG